PHLLGGAEVRRVAGVEEIRIERRAPELALFREHFAQVVRERLDVDRRDASFPSSMATSSKSDYVPFPFCSGMPMPKGARKPCFPDAMTMTALLCFILSVQPRSKQRLVRAAPTAPAKCGRRSVQSMHNRQK